MFRWLVMGGIVLAAQRALLLGMRVVVAAAFQHLASIGLDVIEITGSDVYPITGVGPAPVDAMLAAMGRARRVTARFVARPPPFDLGRLALRLPWHDRHHAAPRHMWLRRLIVAAARDVRGEAGMSRDP